MGYADNVDVAPTGAHLAVSGAYATWTALPPRQANLPINDVNWWEAYAFCIWDGGFLPSEAEFEYAAAGGNQQREYPWGSTDPGTANQYAIYSDGRESSCYYPNDAACTGVANIAPVGYAAQGAGLWGQLDLAGDVWEWSTDWYAAYAACADCADFTETSARAIRGSSFHLDAPNLQPPGRLWSAPTARDYDIGFRCARTP